MKYQQESILSLDDSDSDADKNSKNKKEKDVSGLDFSKDGSLMKTLFRYEVRTALDEQLLLGLVQKSDDFDVDDRQVNKARVPIQGFDHQDQVSQNLATINADDFDDQKSEIHLRNYSTNQTILESTPKYPTSASF